MAAYTFRNAKDPRDVSQHSFDVTKFLAANETIASASIWVAVAGDEARTQPVTLGCSTPVISGKLISTILFGGTAGVAYDVTLEITTTEGMVYNRAAELLVEDL